MDLRMCQVSVLQGYLAQNFFRLYVDLWPVRIYHRLFSSLDGVWCSIGYTMMFISWLVRKVVSQQRKQGYSKTMVNNFLFIIREN